MEPLNDKIAIVTGAASGIGQATAARLAAAGARVLMVDVDAEGLALAAAAIDGEVLTHCADVCDPAQTAGYVQAAVDACGGLHILIANAGISGPSAPLVDTPIAAFDQVLAVNLRGVWLALRAAIPAIKASGGGSIVITSSVLGLKGVRGGAAYVASKHGVTGLMKVAAAEHAADNIRVNCVHPGMIETPMVETLEEAMAPGDREAGRRKLLRGTPLRRYGQPEEIAALIAFLASDAAGYCTGGSYVADGGMLAVS